MIFSLCFIVIKSHLLKLGFSNIDVDGLWEFCVALLQTGIQVFANNRQWSDKYVSVMLYTINKCWIAKNKIQNVLFTCRFCS